MITIGGKDIADIVINNKNVVKVQDATTLEIMWQKTTQITDYFYVENTYNGSNSITITTQSNSPTGNHATSLQYSKDKTNWTTITLSGTNTISMDSGDKVYFRNDNGYFNWYSSSSNRFVTNFVCSENFNVGGNINSLLNYTNNNVSLSPYCFYRLFVDSNVFKLINASNLTLPSTTLAEHCYERMFYNCSNLTTIPTLPATTLADYCYSYMFSGCTSLTTPPSLPATTLEDYCYQRMFSGCTALTTTPTLSSTTLAEHCYSYMFNGCTSLTTTQSLPATTLARYCYEDMFRGCSSLTSVPTLSSTTLADGCYAYMFADCTSLTTAPSLPATTLSAACYSNMFYNCTSLTTPPTLPATTLASLCYNRMFYNCSSLNYINVYANDISASNCIVNWLYGVASTGTFNNYGSASYTYPSASGIPQGWSEGNEYFYIKNNTSSSNIITIGSTDYNNGSLPSGSYADSLEYSTNKSTWTEIYLTGGRTHTVSLSSNGKIYFRNTSGVFNYKNGLTEFYTYFVSSGNIIVGGNVNSLLDYRNLHTVTRPQGCFYNLFEHSTKLIDASSLTLEGNISTSCYQGMFSGCTSLTTPPALPATTLASGCYVEMFAGCTSLTTAPELPAKTLVQYCYSGLFNGCSNLTSITIYADDISATQCLEDWLYTASSTGTFHNLGSATYPTGASGIPSGWTEVHS